MSRRLTCSRCPKWFRGYCGIKAKIYVAGHPACEHGRHFIKNEASRVFMAEKRKRMRNDEV